DRVEAARRMLQRFLVGVLTERVVAGLCPVARGSLEIASLLEVHGQLAGDLAGTRTITGLETLPNPQVKAHTTRDRHARVEGVLIQGVDERVAARHRAGGPCGGSRTTKELPSLHQTLAQLFRAMNVETTRRSHRRRKLSACHTGQLQHSL